MDYVRGSATGSINEFPYNDRLVENLGMEAPELNEEEKTDLMMDYIHKLTGFQELINHYVYSYYFDLVQSNFPNTPASAETMNHNYLVYLMEFFRPRYIIPQSLKIAREMEALGCGG